MTRPAALGADPARLLAASRRAARTQRAPSFAAVDRACWFLPEAFTQLYHTTFYDSLSQVQRLRYNQLYGLRCNEQFMLFEQGFTHRVISGLHRPVRSQGDSILADCLAQMLEEEARHHAMFEGFNRSVLPDCYRQPRGYFTRLSWLESALLRLLTARPRHWPMLVWLVLVLEEFSLGFSRMLTRAGADAVPGDLEPAYVALHRAHRLDEVRHVQLDSLLLQWLMESGCEARNRVNAWLFRGALKEILAPKRSGIRVLRHLVQEFPQLRAREAAMISAVRALGVDPGVDAIISDPAAMPRTRALLDRYPSFTWSD